MTQTLSGSNTLHDTMGILYQNLPCDSGPTSIQQTDASAATVRKSTALGAKKAVKKRSLTAPETPLVPYFCIPKITVFKYKNTSVFSQPNVVMRARHLDLIWMMSHALGTDVLPMWVGFNATTYKDKLPRQDVRYMPNLKESITSLSVVRETLQRTQKCAEECDQQNRQVTYDLNAAKQQCKSRPQNLQDSITSSS